MKRYYLGTALGALGLASGCSGNWLNAVDPGGGASTPTVVSLRKSVSADGKSGGNSATEVPTAVATGAPASLLGRFTLDGPAPVLRPTVGKGSAKADPHLCASAADIPNEGLVLGSKGEIANVFVYLDKAPKNAPPSENPVLDQELCIFKPHALIVRAGVPFNLKNSDSVPHNVKTTPGKNPSENIGMGPKSTAVMQFKVAEKAPFESACAIHAWMNYYTLVLDHPYAAVSAADGTFEIKDLPPGEHQIRIWHERCGPVESRKIKVAGGSPVDLGEIKIPVSKFKL